MNRVKRIKKDVRMGWILKAVRIPVMMIAGIWLILFGMHETGRITAFLILFAIVFASAALTGFIIGSFKAGRIQKRIHYMGADFENDVFEKCADHLYIGKNWLVYHSKEEWLIWRRDHVGRVIIRDHNGLGTRADVAVYLKGNLTGEAFRINGTSYDALNRLESWNYTD